MTEETEKKTEKTGAKPQSGGWKKKCSRKTCNNLAPRDFKLCKKCRDEGREWQRQALKRRKALEAAKTAKPVKLAKVVKVAKPTRPAPLPGKVVFQKAGPSSIEDLIRDFKARLEVALTNQATERLKAVFSAMD